MTHPSPERYRRAARPGQGPMLRHASAPWQPRPTCRAAPRSAFGKPPSHFHAAQRAAGGSGSSSACPRSNGETQANTNGRRRDPLGSRFPQSDPSLHQSRPRPKPPRCPAAARYPCQTGRGQARYLARPGDVAQLGEHDAGSVGVRGSIPLISIPMAPRDRGIRHGPDSLFL